ncbi:class I SAM-dependent methyltransferase [Vibrio sinaloensis]|uniref:class I SAM-dependent methyltransferase n=1 Tax=Photobacterium sp. (strain ATCC 43367) TaxID=379097 RepID=UPI0022AF7290|nr:methyltransferase domain-containing protein [Vibrio sinaloensis]MCZ4294804.1 methyltransferase domain-containing protein [Vibrio sinaloensis]
MSELKNVYDAVYTENESYNFHYPAKDLIVDVYARQVNGNVLDAGCGQGGNLKRLLAQGIDTFGVELSTVCCEKYLADLPHINSDIVGYAEISKQRYDGLICFDVLEHIPETSLDDNLKALSSLSDSALLGIANHSDIQCGEELHLIQENAEWWVSRLKEHYVNAKCIVSLLDDAFFVVEVSNHDDGELKLDERYSYLLDFAHEYDEQWMLRASYEEKLVKERSEKQMLGNQLVEVTGDLNNFKTRYLRILESREIKLSNICRKLFGRRIWE